MLKWAGLAGIAVLAAATFVVAWLALSERSESNGPPAWIPALDSRPASRELRNLVEALSKEPTRPVEGRLSGAFAYAPVAAETRGAGDREISPDVRLAAARIEKLAREHDDAGTRRALGNAYLALGEWDRAVEAFEDAVFQSPSTSAFQSDLSAAYLARAAGGRPDDWARAIAAAKRAIALDPARPEARFNLALAFGGLHMPIEAADAWNAFQSAERSGPWAGEARARLETLKRTSEESLKAAASALDHQRVREQVEDDLLARWGTAVERGDTNDADTLLTDAAQLADRLAADGGDAMPADEVALIRRLQRSGAREAIRQLAIGHRLYGEARSRFAREKLDEASQLLSQASTHLRAAHSPYWQFEPVLRALVLRTQGRPDEALHALEAVPWAGIPPRYAYLRGRAAWIESLVHGGRGRHDLSRDRLARAVEAFRAAGEDDGVIATQTNLAEAEWYLGDHSNAWANLAATLARVELRADTRRTAHFELAAAMALGAGLPEAAVQFHDALVRVTGADGPFAQANAYLRRARALVRIRDYRAADLDLQRASQALAAMADTTLRAQIGTELEITRADVLSGTDCVGAIAHSDTLLDRLARVGGTARRGLVLGIRARCRESRGDFAGATADLVAATELFEARRASIASSADRLQAFELERATFKRLISIQGGPLNDEAAALRTAERARAGVLAEAWGRDRGDLEDLRALPADVAVVYFEVLPDRTLVWVLTRNGREFFTRPMGEADLRHSVDRIQRVIRQGADIQALRPHSASVFETLIAPALAIADRATGSASGEPAIFFVPDGPLFALPFAALPDDEGRALLETRVVAMAPSVRTLLAASARLGTFNPIDVLAVGDGHDAVTTGLPMLPHADGEAADVARLYPKATVLAGSKATKRRFLGTRARVIHFAGHSVLNERDPMLSRMLLAPEPGAGEPGWLAGAEITRDRFGGTDVVVLATCDGAAGRPVQGEGAISVARAFFAAGVPVVVASLWPVDDDLQTLVRTLHQTLIATRDPARALRAGQLSILDERGRRTPVRVWGGFITYGGLVSVRLQEERRG